MRTSAQAINAPLVQCQSLKIVSTDLKFWLVLAAGRCFFTSPRVNRSSKPMRHATMAMLLGVTRTMRPSLPLLVLRRTTTTAAATAFAATAPAARGSAGRSMLGHGLGARWSGRQLVALSTTSDEDLELTRADDDGEGDEDTLANWAGATGGDKCRAVDPGSIYFVATPIGTQPPLALPC